MPTHTPLATKIALVTGGSRGIGAATVRKLAGHGATVIFTYSASAEKAESLAKELTAAGHKVEAVKADASNLPGLVTLANDVAKRHGRIDILVNNAGVLSGGMIGEISAEDYRHVMQINVDAVFTLTNAAVAHIPNGGRIINISSVLGERAITAGISVYNASKFAVNGLTRSWAKDLGPKQITVNAVQPGPTDTDMNPADGEQAAGMIAGIPFGRYGTSQEVADAIAFLAGPDAAFITGVTLSVDGGTNA